MNGDPRIAIVGMGGIFPGAADLAAFERLLRDNHDQSREVPAGRWAVAPDQVFDPTPGRLDRVYSLRGCFLDDELPDPGEDRVAAMALRAARMAWDHVGSQDVRPDRVSVILGAIALPTPAFSELARWSWGQRLRQKLNLPALPRPHDGNRRGVVAGPAQFVAQQLGLAGRAFTLDAACASSLYAVKLGMDELLADRADAVLVGGVSCPDLLYTQMGFAQLRALSKRGRAAPFDVQADGLLVGEGAGVLVLRRLADAQRAGNPVLATIAGVGLSNDVEGKLLAPSSEGQLRAMRQAYAQAEWRPETVDYVECHATGTPLGDATEFASLTQLWRDGSWRPGQAVLGSVKANIGHLLTAANSASLIKVILGFQNERLYPTPNFHAPAPGIALAESPFRILTATETWPRPNDRPRRAAVSGFGFGGINAHLLLEEPDPSATLRTTFLPGRAKEPIAVVAMAARFGAEPTTAAALARLGDPSAAAGSGRMPEQRVAAETFHIPPVEWSAMLPQQVLALRLAHETSNDRTDAAATAVFLGVDLDFATMNYHLRWTAADWSGDLNPTSDPGTAQWLSRLVEERLPPLTADRVMGNLASIAASRIAREFKCGGPCFTVSSGADSGLTACRLAMDALRAGEVRQALVGAVDFATEPRRVDHRPPAIQLEAADGGAVLVLKLASQAATDGDTILALMDEVVGPEIDAAPDIAADVGAATEMIRLAAAIAAVAEKAPHRVGFLQVSAAAPAPTIAPPEPVEVFPLVAANIEALVVEAARCVNLLSREPDRWRQIAHQMRAQARASAGSARCAVVAASAAEAARLMTAVTERRDDLRPTDAALGEPVFVACHANVLPPELAFVFPGSGNATPKMGRELVKRFPTACGDDGLASDARDADRSGEGVDSVVAGIIRQVRFGQLVTRILNRVGLRPNAALGFSLGESAALVAMGAWPATAELFERLRSSPLFTEELTGPCHAARRFWRWPEDRPFEWSVCLVRGPAETVGASLDPTRPTRLLAVLSPAECVVGGEAAAVTEWRQQRRWPAVPLTGIAAVHGPMARSIEPAYRALHLLPTAAVPGVRFYSGAWGRAYVPDPTTAAASITAAAMDCLNFRRTIDAAYADGVRVFVEIGPGSSCTRAIRDTLGDRPHQAFSLHGADEVRSLMLGLARLFVLGYPVDWAALEATTMVSCEKPGGTPASLMPLSTTSPLDDLPEPPPFRSGAFATLGAPPPEEQTTGPLGVLQRWVQDRGQAHAAYLRFAARASDLLAQAPGAAATGELPIHPSEQGPSVFLTRDQCLTFATGRIGEVLGPDFAAIDGHPTRVRLPAEPLMLVDRVLSVAGEAGSLGSGQVVTEHDVLPGAWYLDGGRIPTCIAVEAGQADLFLSAYLGIDRVTRGRAVYRLLDAVVTFHDELPRAGATIHYDIHIDHFFRQEQTHLFRFRFEATVNGRPLLTMRDGCAGFFTPEELAAGRGVVQTEFQKQPRPGERDPRIPLVPGQRESYAWWQLLCLRQGDLPGCFGPDFAGLPLANPLRLPGGPMKLFDRVIELDPSGGRFGIGRIRTELDIHPDDWFLTCHFVDDQVMPGTLMYECCLHSLRFMLYRLGWLAEADEVACTPVPGVASRLKCRGQVTATTRVAAFEIDMKTLGYGPDAYAVADALMFADGKPIVEITDMSLRLSGLSAERAAAVWANRQPPAEAAAPATGFGPERIRAFAVGRPSEAFGPPYRPFDAERRIARLPGPPYQFLDRITALAAEPWELRAGGTVTAEYDVPRHAWYFSASRQPVMPFAVLLEVALQPCGWLAAYLGSALTSDEDLAFRNLGGTATQHRPVPPDVGTLTTQVKITQVAQSAGMIIQHFDFAVAAATGPIYDGNTYFGFFTQAALRDQVGIKELTPFREVGRPPGHAPVHLAPPWPDARWRMLNTLEVLTFDGGPFGLGYAQGCMRVDPAAWFFAAHFYQDPVCPGSLGLESLVELLKMIAMSRWGADATTVFETPRLGRRHQWTYRGQVIPTHERVTVQAWPKTIDDDQREIVADGLLMVDGRVIYRMQDFSLRLAHP